MIAHLLIIILVLVTSAVYMAVGRMVLTHTGTSGRDSTPLHCFAVGLSVWYLWFLLLHGVVGAGLTVVWYTYLISALGLGVVLTKVLKFEKEHVFFWPKIIIGVLLISPALGYLTTDGPVLWAELSYYLKNVDHMLRLDGVPNVKNAIELDIFSPGIHVASQIMSLPVMLMTKTFQPAVETLFNCIIIVIAAGEMVRHCGVKVGWHNLVFVSSLALFGLTLFNPFFIESLVFSSYPDVIIAAIILSLSVPLMRSERFPIGMEAIPYGFLLAYLSGLSPLGMPLAIFMLSMVCLRVGFERKLYKDTSVNVFLGLCFAALMLVVGFMLLRFHMATRGLSLRVEDVFGSDGVFLVAAAMGREFFALGVSQPVIIAVLLLVMVMGAWHFVVARKGRSIGHIFVEDGYVVFPAFLSVIYLFAIGGSYLSQFASGEVPFSQGIIHYALHLQFVVLIPIWVWMFKVYKTTFPQQEKSASGMLSLVSALLFLGVIITNGQRLKFEAPASLDHTLRVAQSIKAGEVVSWGQKIAVLDGVDTKGYYAVALGYGLRHYGHVRPVLQEFADSRGSFDTFHDKLLADKYKYLWVHTVTPDIAAVLGENLREDYSYLYQVTGEGLVPLHRYAHAAYTYKSASYVPRY